MYYGDMVICFNYQQKRWKQQIPNIFEFLVEFCRILLYISKLVWYFSLFLGIRMGWFGLGGFCWRIQACIAFSVWYIPAMAHHLLLHSYKIANTKSHICQIFKIEKNFLFLCFNACLNLYMLLIMNIHPVFIVKRILYLLTFDLYQGNMENEDLTYVDLCFACLSEWRDVWFGTLRNGDWVQVLNQQSLIKRTPNQYVSFKMSMSLLITAEMNISIRVSYLPLHSIHKQIGMTLQINLLLIEDASQ